ncbi:MAG TPA: bifunctional riboflavin kinase/FAD synthetase [Caldithrix abyssi]|uniref:Riboflavin biosynthesis protein n=1 Tax=Caldithrix abyssi TaxID=187145 RepID=A0A7V4WV18_CALAY|nr:bifunctional riboflavin kinase/FAD synthetase [Caldithrix abyssi]
MEIIRGLEHLRPGTECAATVGTFDGVHPGHLKLINRLVELGSAKGLCTTLVTFYPHPKLVVGGKNVRLLTTIEEKIELLGKTKLQRMVIIPFDRSFSKLSYEQFVRDILIDKLKTRALVIGYDHAFGRNREGNYERLKEMGSRLGFSVERVEPFRLNDRIVGSTLIRETLAAGRVDEAARMLQRLYTISGRVVHGSARGKLLHFPTANVEVDNENKLIPADGVYAVDVYHKGRSYKGMLNIGCRPTFKNGKQHVIEVHIIDFNENIYDQTITIAFKKRLRDEKKFESKEALIKQLEKDRAESLKL